VSSNEGSRHNDRVRRHRRTDRPNPGGVVYTALVWRGINDVRGSDPRAATGDRDIGGVQEPALGRVGETDWHNAVVEPDLLIAQVRDDD